MNIILMIKIIIYIANIILMIILLFIRDKNDIFPVDVMYIIMGVCILLTISSV